MRRSTKLVHRVRAGPSIRHRGHPVCGYGPVDYPAPGWRQSQTDARDAMLLALLLRLDEIVPVTVPTVVRYAAGDLARAHEDVHGHLLRARHCVSKLLLRQGIVYYGGSAWTGTHLRWLRKQHVDIPGPAAGLRRRTRGRLTCLSAPRLDAAIVAMAADSEYTPVVQRMGCLRGVATLTGFGLAVEVGDWERLTARTGRGRRLRPGHGR